MDIIWIIVGALWAVYNWICDTIARIGLTNWILIFLLYEVYKIRETYIEFESAKLARNSRDENAVNEF
jgi:hypothetical protein